MSSLSQGWKVKRRGKGESTISEGCKVRKGGGGVSNRVEGWNVSRDGECVLNRHESWTAKKRGEGASNMLEVWKGVEGACVPNMSKSQGLRKRVSGCEGKYQAFGLEVETNIQEVKLICGHSI